MKAPENISLNTRSLYFGFGFLLLAFVALAFYNYQQFAASNQLLSNEVANHNQQSGLAMQMRVAVRERAILLWQMTVDSDPFVRDEYFQEFYEFGAIYKKARFDLLDTDLSGREKALITSLDLETTKRAPALRKFGDLLMGDEGHERYGSLLKKTIADQVIVSDLLDELIQLQQSHNEEARQRNVQRAKHHLTQLVVGISVIIILGVLFARRVIKSADSQNQQLSDANEELSRLASYDHLTGLPNRLLLLEHLEQGLSMAKRHGQVGALLYIDLDGFKTLNDTYGHGVGDKFLRAVSSEMSKLLRESDIAARLGGDEFVVALFNIRLRDRALVVADKLLSRLSSTYEIDDLRMNVSASIGVAFFPSETVTPHELLKRADDAMYLAKERGKNRYVVSE